MKEANKALLDKHRPIYDVLIRAQYLKGLNGQEINELLQVMHEEFQPGYATDLWCGPCLIDFVKLLYRMYDDWIARQPKEEPIIVAASFPAHTEPPALPIPKPKHHRHR